MIDFPNTIFIVSHYIYFKSHYITIFKELKLLIVQILVVIYGYNLEFLYIYNFLLEYLLWCLLFFFCYFYI